MWYELILFMNTFIRQNKQKRSFVVLNIEFLVYSCYLHPTIRYSGIAQTCIISVYQVFGRYFIGTYALRTIVY